MNTKSPEIRGPFADLGGSTHDCSGSAARLLDELLLDRIGLQDVPRHLFAWYVAGSCEGTADADRLRAEVARLNRECDRLWLWAFGDEARRDYLLGRLELAFAVADRPDVADLVAEAARVFLRGLDNMQGVAA